jgi:hypothetical protein
MEPAPPASDAGEAPSTAAPDLGGRSPFDFGSILDSAGVEAEKEEEKAAPPAFLEPTVVGREGASSAKHDLGGVDDVVEPVREERKEKEEEVVLPKPTGKTAFVAPPGLDVSIGREIDAGLAEIYLERGFKDKAISTYERLLEMHPDKDDYRKRLMALKGGEPPAEMPEEVFPSEILDPISDRAMKEESSTPGDTDGFSEAATPEGDHTISLSDLFKGGSQNGPGGSAPEPPHPAQETKGREKEESGEKGQPKGGFNSFQSWLDGLGK